MREEMIIPVFFRKVPESLRSMPSQPSRTFSNPRASEYPKSPSPTTASRSPKYFSLSTAVRAMVRTTNSTCS